MNMDLAQKRVDALQSVDSGGCRADVSAPRPRKRKATEAGLPAHQIEQSQAHLCSQTESTEEHSSAITFAAVRGSRLSEDGSSRLTLEPSPKSLEGCSRFFRGVQHLKEQTINSNEITAGQECVGDASATAFDLPQHFESGTMEFDTGSRFDRPSRSFLSLPIISSGRIADTGDTADISRSHEAGKTTAMAPEELLPRAVSTAVDPAHGSNVSAITPLITDSDNSQPQAAANQSSTQCLAGKERASSEDTGTNSSAKEDDLHLQQGTPVLGLARPALSFADPKAPSRSGQSDETQG
ncbi:unnamed protein product [Jaminaea pallidilutea]